MELTDEARELLGLAVPSINALAARVGVLEGIIQEQRRRIKRLERAQRRSSA